MLLKWLIPPADSSLEEALSDFRLTRAVTASQALQSPDLIILDHI
jgi:hypothetical protein